jgi:hypothetical protein
MKKRNKKVYDDDDGRVISPMNLDGMPWSRGGMTDREPQEGNRNMSPKDENEIELTPKEKRAMMGGVFAAAFLVAGAFLLAGFLFILFCIHVWFR